MGEYVKRKSDGESIKIGTCQTMYYLRLEDKDMVELEPGSGFGIYFRPPFPDEDNVSIGEYTPFKGSPLYGGEEDGPFTDPDTIGNPGLIQLSHESGLLINIPCYHGEKLPESSENIKTFWNGKARGFYELAYLKETEGGVLPVVQCRFCKTMWSYDWDEILPYIHGEFKERLLKYSK